jgi:hypothetical protein
MAGQGIQEALKETAKSMGDHGKLMETSIKKQGNFRDSLKEGWLTTDVYTKAMSVFGGTSRRDDGQVPGLHRRRAQGQGIPTLRLSLCTSFRRTP